ncbi:MAG: hypothetical protein AAGA68_16235 [Pseudomonadota bacterium]
MPRMLASSALIFALTISAGHASSLEYDFETTLPGPGDAITVSFDAQGDVAIGDPTIMNGLLFLGAGSDGFGADAVSQSFLVNVFSGRNVSVSADIDAAGDSDDEALVFARADFDSQSAYTAGVDLGTGTLFISRSAGGVSERLLESTVALPGEGPLNLTLTVIDDLLTATLLDSFGMMIAMETIEDLSGATLGAGLTGVGIGFGAAGTGEIALTIDSYAAEVIPLPGAVWLLSGGVGLLAARARRRKG